MNKFQKIGTFLTRLLVVWLVLLAIQAIIGFITVVITSKGHAPFGALIGPVLLLVGAFVLHVTATTIGGYLGKDLGD